MHAHAHVDHHLFLRPFRPQAHPFVSLNKVLAVVQMVQRLGERNTTAVSVLATALRLERQVGECQTTYPDASVGLCLAATLATMHPCPKAGGAAEIMTLATNWTAWAKRARPQAVVNALAHLSDPQAAARDDRAHGGGPSFVARLFPAGRFALHWLFGICGIGPPILRQSGLGWDTQLATLACALGHKTVVLAASSNDNGLLHQEFVDFDVPEPLGWAGIPDEGAVSGTNDMNRCLQPFRWVQRDRAAGIRAEAMRHEQLRASLVSTHKFMLAPGEPCALRFGPNGSVSDEVERFKACRVPRPRSAMSDDKACWAWCDGGMSQAFSATSLLQVRSIKAARGRWQGFGGRKRSGRLRR